MQDDKILIYYAGAQVPVQLNDIRHISNIIEGTKFTNTHIVITDKANNKYTVILNYFNHGYYIKYNDKTYSSLNDFNKLIPIIRNIITENIIDTLP